MAGQQEQLGGVAERRGGAPGAQPAGRVGPDRAVQRPVGLRVALGELGVDQVAHEVVQVQAGAGVPDERPGREPRPHLRGPLAHRLGEQVLGGAVGVRARGEAGAVRGVGHVADEHVAELGHEVGPLVEPARRAALRRRLGEQHERERVAPTKLRQPRAGRGGGAEAAHQVRALGGVQRGERAGAQEPPPARVGRPRRIRWLPTGQYRDGARGQRRQQLAAEPAVERGEQLVGVDEQHRAGVVGHGRDGRRHGGDRPGHVAAVEADHRPAAGHRPPAHLVEQRGLADAARAVDEQHPGGGVAVQGGTERRQLGGPAHEAEPAGVVEGARQGVAHPAIVDMRCRSSGY